MLELFVCFFLRRAATEKWTLECVCFISLYAECATVLFTSNNSMLGLSKLYLDDILDDRVPDNNGKQNHIFLRTQTSKLTCIWYNSPQIGVIHSFLRRLNPTCVQCKGCAHLWAQPVHLCVLGRHQRVYVWMGKTNVLFFLLSTHFFQHQKQNQ